MRGRFCFLVFALCVAATAQTWSGSGSNGSDGALDLGANTAGVVAGVLVFDSVALNKDADGDNIYHFTTITIRDGIRVQFKANKLRHTGPVVFLASGAVNIQGILDFSGEAGNPYDANEANRRASIPGPGGYPGGAGARVGGTAMQGLGPGAGRVATPASLGCPGAFVTNSIPSWCSGAGAPPTYGNSLIQPLVGGSGGSGTTPSGQNFGAGGGAGGGAIRISSSVSIAFGSGVNPNGAVIGCNSNYYIVADGGDGGSIAGGPGAGGSIHLQAPVIAGCGLHIYVDGGNQQSVGRTSSGRVRLDSSSPPSIVVNTVTPLTGALVDVPLPSSPAQIRIVSVNGVSAPANPTSSYSLPDVTTNSSGQIPIAVQAANIPVNTPVTLYLTTDTGTDLTSQVNLSGTVASSTATLNVTLPQGVSRLLVRAVW